MHRVISNKVIIGTWPLSGDFGPIKKKTIFKTIEKCLKNNFLEFDTAPTYGNGSIYHSLQEVLQNVKGVKINTKCGYNSQLKKTFKIKDIISSINYSLDTFGKINIMFLHNPRDEIKNWPKLISLLEDYKKKKLIKKIGISFARNFYFKEEVMNCFDYFQDEINLLRPNAVNFLSSFKPKIIARSPLASGCLSGKLNKKSNFHKDDYRSSWLNDKKRLENIIFQVEQLKKILPFEIKKSSKFFLLQNNKINKVIFGVKKPSHVEELKKDIINFKIINKNQIRKFEKLVSLNFNLSKKLIKY